MAEQSDQELLAMFASPDDWTAEALESAKAELRKRGSDGPGEPPPAIPERGEDQPDIYEYFGTYSNEDARLLLDAFISADIAYTLDVDKMGLANMSPFRASIGGRFGMGVGIAIGVHTNDCERAMEIRQHVLKILS
jgi:hypothetical protein